MVSLPRLLPADRCDRCGARAAVRVANEDKAFSVLDLCTHHWMQFQRALHGDGWRVVASA